MMADLRNYTISDVAIISNPMISHRKIHFINFSRRLAVSTLTFLIPLYFLKIGFVGWQIGLIVSCFGFAPLLFSFPIGLINDRLMIERIIQGALLSLSLLIFLLSATKNFFLIALIFLFLGLANNALDVSINSLYYKEESNKNLNKKYGLLAFWLALGMACGTLLGGMLTHFASFHVLFYVYAVFLLLVLLFSHGLGGGRFDRVPIKEYKLSLLNKKTILFAILMFALSLHWGVEGTVYSPFLKKYFQFNNLQLSLYISLPLFVLSFSAFFIGLLKYNARVNKRIFLLSMFLSGLGHVLMVNRIVYISFFFRVVHEVGDGFLGALNVLYISKLFEKRSIGGSSGILLAVMTFGYMVSALIFSSLGYKFGLQYPFYISGLILIGNALFGYYVFRRQEY